VQKENPCHVFTRNAPSGVIHGSALGVYTHSLLDYASSIGIPAVSGVTGGVMV
jgi:glutaminase